MGYTTMQQQCNQLIKPLAIAALTSISIVLTYPNDLNAQDETLSEECRQAAELGPEFRDVCIEMQNNREAIEGIRDELADVIAEMSTMVIEINDDLFPKEIYQEGIFSGAHYRLIGIEGLSMSVVASPNRDICIVGMTEGPASDEFGFMDRGCDNSFEPAGDRFSGELPSSLENYRFLGTQDVIWEDARLDESNHHLYLLASLPSLTASVHARLEDISTAVPGFPGVRFVGMATGQTSRMIGTYMNGENCGITLLQDPSLGEDQLRIPSMIEDHGHIRLMSVEFENCEGITAEVTIIGQQGSPDTYSLEQFMEQNETSTLAINYIRNKILNISGYTYFVQDAINHANQSQANAI